RAAAAAIPVRSGIDSTAFGVACSEIVRFRRRRGAAIASLDPLHEPASRALMHIHADRGQVAQALKLYDTLRERLNNELGVRPAPETTRLYEAIKQQRSASAAANPLPAEPLHSTTILTIPLPDKPSIAV